MASSEKCRWKTTRDHYPSPGKAPKKRTKGHWWTDCRKPPHRHRMRLVATHTPCANSVTTQNSLGVSKVSSIWMMFSCLRLRKISISCRRLRISLADFPSLTMNFMAVICPVARRRPLYTCSGHKCTLHAICHAPQHAASSNKSIQPIGASTIDDRTISGPMIELA
jgi:hypothetical protein